jgi:hypothetical protein
VTVFTVINTRGMMGSFDSSITSVRRNVSGKINKLGVLNIGDTKKK